MEHKTKEQKNSSIKTNTKKIDLKVEKNSTKITKEASLLNTSTEKISNKQSSKITNKEKSPKSKTPSKKDATNKKTSKKDTEKVSTTKKTSKKDTEKVSTTKKNYTTLKNKTDIIEYYDLPYRYNKTVVKLLSQTPNTLFIYWDISDIDKENFKKQYGDNFFENSKPVLIIHNDTLNYSFEVEINDFANSWYLNVADSKCDYIVELGRRPIVKTELLNNDYIHISTSNEIESPNDHILLDRNQKMAYFRNIKTGEKSSKNISSVSFIRNIGKIYNIYDLYKSIYQNENIDEIYKSSNPSS